MRRLFAYILLLLSPALLSAASISVDKEWYVAGEQMLIDIDLDDDMSCVGYIELSDTEGVKAGTVVSACKGKATAGIILPSTLHSGYYRLTAYSRTSAAYCMNVAIVNTLHASADDDITWEELQTGTSHAIDNTGQIQKIAINSAKTGAETIGHTILAKIKKPSHDISALLSIVGKQVRVFAGKQINDSIVAFYTYDVYGKQNVVASAYDSDGNSMPIEIMSPYEAILPDSLPKLQFSYVRNEVEARSIAMQQQAYESRDTVTMSEYDETVFSVKPFFSYDLNEYRQFATINDTFVEYVNFVMKSTDNGKTQLYVFSKEEGYSAWSPLVLIDGMPTRDFDRLLKYDARRIHHINIYTDWFSLGTNAIYKGILSFVTRSGSLTNYHPDDNSAFIVYDFPK